ncbi:SH3 domain-containing protein [uncultured Gammaproteobacteria bacterium]
MKANSSNWLRTTIAALAIGSLMLSGCSTRDQRIGADDGTDTCRAYRVALDSTGDFFAEDMIKGAAVGALGGALIGGLTGDWKGALIGAAVGAAVGASAGYWNHLQEQQKDQAVLSRTVLTDLDKENGQIDQAQRAFNQLVDCRTNEANKVRAQLKAGQITRPAAEARIAQIKGQYQKDLELARLINENMQKRSANFEVASENLNPGSATKLQALSESKRTYEDAAPGKVARPRPPKPAKPMHVAATPQEQVLEATSSNVAKRNDYQATVQTASAKVDSGFNLDAG